MLRKLTVILAFVPMLLWGQSKVVTGTVTGSGDGMPLPGVSVLVKGTSQGTSTDFDGNYSIKVKEGSVLQFSYVGFTTKEIKVRGSKLNVVLQESAEALEEVVVTALGIKKEQKALGYSLTEVKGDDMVQVKQTNAINALQGKVAGVNVTQNATGSAGSSRVIIRGASSLTEDNQPLYVVDGIPISNVNNGSAGMWGGSDGGDGISSINPDDIASVSVLKGGAASALYGSRAADGVIIITTKSGKGQKGFGIELSSSVLFDQVDTTLRDYQTSYGQGKRGKRPATVTEVLDMGVSSWGEKLDGVPTVQWDGVKRPYSYVGNNLDHFYRTGISLINTLAITDGNEKLNYRLSASDFSNEDILPNSGLDRKTFSLNLGSVLAEKLTVNANIKYVIEDVKNRSRLSDSPGNPNFTVANLPGNVDVRTMNPGVNKDGTERVYTNNVWSQNPYFAVHKFKNSDVRHRFISSASLRYNFTDWLYILGRAGIDHYTRKGISVEPWGVAYKPEGSIRESEIIYTQIDSDLMLGFEKDLSEDFSVTGFIGANKNSVKQEGLFLGGQKFIVKGLEDLANTKEQNRSRSFSQKKIGSLYGSLEMAYKKYAYLTVTGRNDWFSTLSFPGKETPNDDFYYSANASLILSKMFEMPEEISFLKLRGGYSEVAGGAQNPYQLSFLYEIFGQGHLGQFLGKIATNTIPNANLVPFVKKESEIGLDARFFDSRLSFDIAVYKNQTTKDIVPVSVSVFSGYGSVLANIGVIENKGIEGLVSIVPIRTENFQWNMSLNAAYNDGKIVATNEENGEISLGEPRTRNVQIKQIVGENFGTIVGVSYERDENGMIKYNISDEGIPKAVEGPRKVLGTGVPPLTLGLTNSFSYKNFNLSFLIDGKFGGQIFSGTNTVLYGNGLHKETLKGRENGLEVTGINAKTGAQFTTIVKPEDLSIYYDEISDIAEEFVYDADFIKLRQLSLGYSFPKKYLDKIFFNGIDISVVATNLFYLKRSVDNIDPESAYNVGNAQGLEYFGVPSRKSYGVNFKFKF